MNWCWANDELMMDWWWRNEELMSWWGADEMLMMCWWFTNDDLMIKGWWTVDDHVMIMWWYVGKLMNTILYLNVLCRRDNDSWKFSFWSRKTYNSQNMPMVVVGRWRYLTAFVPHSSKLSFSFFQIRMKNGTKSVWDYPTLFLWDHPTFFSIYPTSIPQKGVVHFC